MKRWISYLGGSILSTSALVLLNMKGLKIFWNF